MRCLAKLLFLPILSFFIITCRTICNSCTVYDRNSSLVLIPKEWHITLFIHLTESHTVLNVGSWFFLSFISQKLQSFLQHHIFCYRKYCKVWTPTPKTFPSWKCYWLLPSTDPGDYFHKSSCKQKTIKYQIKCVNSINFLHVLLL